MDLLHVLRPSCQLNSTSDCLGSLLHSCLGMETLVPALENGIRTWKDSDHHHCFGMDSRMKNMNSLGTDCYELRICKIIISGTSPAPLTTQVTSSSQNSS